MRVISGSARGRRLVAPRGGVTRPTPDRVRESLFSMLAANIAEARVLDLYAGTGALGLEALSRGAGEAVFVEKDREPLSALRENIEALGFEHAQVLALPVQRALPKLGAEGRTFDLIFADPPYAKNLLDGTLQGLTENNVCASSAIVVCEHSGKSPGPSHLAFETLETRTYGDVAVTLLRAVAQ